MRYVDVMSVGDVAVVRVKGSARSLDWGAETDQLRKVLLDLNEDGWKRVGRPHS